MLKPFSFSFFISYNAISILLFLLFYSLLPFHAFLVNTSLSYEEDKEINSFYSPLPPQKMESVRQKYRKQDVRAMSLFNKNVNVYGIMRK